MNFLEETSHTDWANLEAYRDKMIQRIQLVNLHPFEVEYVQNIMKQKCDNLDCGFFVAGYPEYLSKGMDVPFVGFEEEYHQMRYASLFQNCGIRKAKKYYVSENDDPPRPRTKTILLPDESGIVSIE
ncbi:hypothetical protein T459_27459 [Capsicum annuum]|uniref:Ubiquitin-like protease family profile domain-containing protein n=1 Tax=Capsicum annuum TaxID=4072 RepID=A0A2G2YDZ3_CAPAN|nr:hypothetical protein T459_27459 [Capsicum annuum]